MMVLLAVESYDDVCDECESGNDSRKCEAEFEGYGVLEDEGA